jgi:electron transfer flavoprotein alpha subunit
MSDDADPYSAFLQNYQAEAAPREPTRAESAPPGEYRNIWIWIEHVDREVYPASIENLGKGRELADQLGARCHAVLFGHKVKSAAEKLGEFGADGVFLADDPKLAEFHLQVYRELFVRLVKEHRPEAILFPATVMGRNLGAQLAAALGTGIVPNCMKLEVDASERKIRHFQTSFEERLLSEIVIPKTQPQITTITPGSFRKPMREKGKQARIIDVNVVDLPAPRTLVGKREAPIEKSVEQSEVVVVGGLALGSRESFRLTEELSALLGGHVGGTRAAVACGWCDPRILVTSTKHRLRPRLYVAAGVIVEYDHLKAVEGARQVVAITPDPEAPITDHADLIGIGDPTAILQAMLENLKASRKERFLIE